MMRFIACPGAEIYRQSGGNDFVRTAWVREMKTYILFFDHNFESYQK
jgi:hypothetical protein